MKNFLILIFSLLILGGCKKNLDTPSDTYFTVEGYVTDALSGDAIEGVTVKLWHSVSQQGAANPYPGADSVLTDKKGHYLITSMVSHNEYLELGFDKPDYALIPNLPVTAANDYARRDVKMSLLGYLVVTVTNTSPYNDSDRVEINVEGSQTTAKYIGKFNNTANSTVFPVVAKKHVRINYTVIRDYQQTSFVDSIDVPARDTARYHIDY